MKSYEIASEEGVVYAAGKSGQADLEVGMEIELKLDENQERALIAAGWLSEPAKKKKEG